MNTCLFYVRSKSTKELIAVYGTFYEKDIYFLIYENNKFRKISSDFFEPIIFTSEKQN
jgi:hypothetical protein